MALKSGDVIPENVCTRVDALPVTFFKNEEGIFLPEQGIENEHAGTCFRSSKKDAYLEDFEGNDLPVCNSPNRMNSGEILRLSHMIDDSYSDISRNFIVSALENEFHISGPNRIRSITDTYLITGTGTFTVDLDSLWVDENAPLCGDTDQLTYSAEITTWGYTNTFGDRMLLYSISLSIDGPNGLVPGVEVSPGVVAQYPAFLCQGNIAHGGMLYIH